MKSAAEVRPFAALDIEAVGNTWDVFDLAVGVTHSGEVEHFDTQEEMQHWVEEYSGRVAAHSGGTYDFHFLRGKDQVLLTGSRILTARLGKAQLLDTYPMMPMSLKKIGKAVGLEKLDVDRSRLAELSRDEVRTYCERDAQVLARALHRHRDFCLSVPHTKPSWPSTAGATAVYCAEAYEGEAVRHMARHPLSPETWREHAETVQGGRTEVWRLGHVKGPVYCYDVKSSYPARYLEEPLPVGPWAPVSHEVHGVPGVWRVKFSQPTDRIPVLSADGVFCHRGEGWCTSEELYAARNELGARVEVLHGWVTRRLLPFGENFVRTLYRLKEQGSPFAKVCLNALHGKFGQRIRGGTYRRWGAGDADYVLDEELSLPRWYQRPLVEAHLLARARVALWRCMDALHRAGWAVLYTDTDSIHTDASPADFERVTGATMGEGLGQWELKGTARRALYLARKCYALEWEDGEQFIACKGFPQTAPGEKPLPHHVTWEKLEEAWEHPVEVVEPRWGLQGWARAMDSEQSAKSFQRTLAAHAGAGKVRRGADVWYAH